MEWRVFFYTLLGPPDWRLYIFVFPLFTGKIMFYHLKKTAFLNWNPFEEFFLFSVVFSHLDIYDIILIQTVKFLFLTCQGWSTN